MDRCHELLNNNFIPYHDSLMDDDNDEELRWGIVKNGYLLKNEKFRKMYAWTGKTGLPYWRRSKSEKTY